MSRWINIFGWILLMATLVALMAFSHAVHGDKILDQDDIFVVIHRDAENQFLNRDDLVEIAANGVGSGEMKTLDQYNGARLEKVLKKHPYIENAEVYISIDGILNVEVWERRPIARIYTGNDSYYMDDKGRLMPVSSAYTAHTVVFSGMINEPYSKRYNFGYNAAELPDTLDTVTVLDDIFKLSTFLDEHSFWGAQIEQVYVDKDSGFQLIPRVGNHRIVLGEADRLKDKFTKLKLFYKEGLSKTGWNEYKVVNLKFKNQVVCIKR